LQVLVTDIGCTGMSDRPGLRHLVKAAERGLVSEVVAISPSRLARSHVELARLLRRFDQLGVRVTFASQAASGAKAHMGI